jgi:hypothetical protein
MINKFYFLLQYFNRQMTVLIGFDFFFSKVTYIYCNDSAPCWDLDWTIKSYLILYLQYSLEECVHELARVILFHQQ